MPQREFDRLARHLESAELPVGTVLHEAGSPVRQLYFPTSGIVSKIQVMADGDSAEIAVVGCEGVVGITTFLGGESISTRAMVHSAGHAWCLKQSTLRTEYDRGGALQRLLLRYTQALVTQIAQTALCNRHHTVEQQLCRWLLMSLDRLAKNELMVTQELIAGLLGVRREGITAAAGKLQEAGLIRNTRGHIEVLDRQKLERRSCACYSVVKDEYDRLLRPPLK